jgi:murein DD-endopeptidase MepM/ murein hydrolase activator NlpD
MRTRGLIGAPILGAALSFITPNLGETQQPRLSVAPAKPNAGALVRLTLDRLAGASDSVVDVGGIMAGEPLRFRPAGAGKLQALGAIPIDVSDSLVARVTLRRQSGVVDTLSLTLEYPHQAAPAVAASRGRATTASRLQVDPKFTRASAANDARVARENEQARGVGRRAQDTPQLWTLPFLRPRETPVTSRFGTGRVFNGRVSSRHLGIDYRGKTGEPVVAANRGVVALVGEFFLAGNVVYIDHGNGIVTSYFHLSRQEVAVGDTVERGQQIGLVGSTGRVTGPHLHWSARFGGLTIDPGDLLSLTAPFVGGSVQRTHGDAGHEPRD